MPRFCLRHQISVWRTHAASRGPSGPSRALQSSVSPYFEPVSEASAGQSGAGPGAGGQVRPMPPGGLPGQLWGGWGQPVRAPGFSDPASTLLAHFRV